MESLWKKILEWFLLINWIIPIGFSPEKTFHTTYLQPVADTNVGTDKTCPLRHPRSADFLLAPSFPKRNYNCRSFLRLKKKESCQPSGSSSRFIQKFKVHCRIQRVPTFMYNSEGFFTQADISLYVTFRYSFQKNWFWSTFTPPLCKGVRSSYLLKGISSAGPPDSL